MTALRTKTQFPDPAESPWENPDNGLTYEWNGWGWDIVTPEDPADPDEDEPPAGSAFTFTFSVCKEADFSDDGSIFFELSNLKDDFSVPLQTANKIKYGAKDINGSTTPLIKDDWDLHIYAEDVSSSDRGGVTLGWRTAQGVKDEDRTTIGIVQDSINSSLTKIEEGSLVQLIFTPKSAEDVGVEISEGLPAEPWQEGDLYFDVTEDELTLYVYLGDDWAPAAPPVSLDGIQNDIFSLQEVANDVRKQLAYHTIEAQKADGKILDLENSVADLNKKVDAIEVPEVESLDALKQRISALEGRLNLYEKYEKAPATVAWKWQGKKSSTSAYEIRWDNSKFLYVSHTPWIGTCRKLDHGKWSEGSAHDINGGLMSLWVYRDERWYQTMILHIRKYRINFNGWFQFEYTWWTGKEPESDEPTYVSMSGMF